MCMCRIQTAPCVVMLSVALSFAACDRGMAKGQDGSSPPAMDGAATEAPESDAGVPADAADAAAAPQAAGKLFQLLDDMEGGQLNLVTPIGLASWFAGSADPTVASTAAGAFGIADLDSPRDTSQKALHARVAGPGAIDVRIDFHGPGFQGGGPPYPDLAAYAGIAFWSRGLSAAGSLVVAIEDHTVISGKSYAETQASVNPWFEHPAKLTSQWRRHILLFDDFRQPTLPAGRLRTEAIWSLHLLGGLDGTGAEFWIDDLALLCRGRCPNPAWDVFPTQGTGIDDKSLTWVGGEGTSANTTCAVIAALSISRLSDVPVDIGEKLFLRVRIPIDPAPAVPIWAWTVKHVPSGAMIDVTAVDEGWSTVAVPITEPGPYRVVAHTHYPGTDVCGVEANVDAR